MLLLFDIDGTLLRDAARAHALALHAALRDVYGLASPDGDEAALPRVQAAGRTDMEIAREIALLCGLSAERFDDGRRDLMAVCLREYVRLVPDDLSGRVVEGMRDLLRELDDASGVILSLVTGNLEGIARVKLDRAGLGSFFPSGQGGFGSDSDDRTDLPEIARERAGAARERARGADGAAGLSRAAVPYPRERTIVIGDTVLDIACAHADGVRCVAVTTGPHGADDLGQADAIAGDVGELRDLLLAGRPARGD